MDHDGAAGGARRAERARRLAEPAGSARSARPGRRPRAWLDPVVGASDRRGHAGSAAEDVAVHRVLPDRRGGGRSPSPVSRSQSCASSRRLSCRSASAEPEHGFEHVLDDKYYVDEIYDEAVVKPLVGVSRNVLWRGIDRRDHRQSLREWIARCLRAVSGWIGSQLQSGADGRLCVGDRDRCARRSWRFHLPLSDARLPRPDRLQRLDPSGAPPDSAGRCAAARDHGCAVQATTARRRSRIARRALDRALAFVLEFVVSMGLWWSFDPAGARWQASIDHCVDSVPWGARFSMGIDGISLMMVLLTTVIMPLAVLGSWTSIRTKVRSYYALMLVLTTGMLGVFVSRDLLLFYVMWEIMLVPMYFIIGIWGGERRIYASLKFFIYTMAARCSCSSASCTSGTRRAIADTGARPDFDYDRLLTHRALAQGGALALRRVLPRLRGEGADVPVPHVAARRARRGADRRLGDSGGDHAQDGDVRLPSSRGAALPVCRDDATGALDRSSRSR